MLDAEEYADLREDVEATLFDTCRITRGAERGDFDPETGTYDTDESAIVFEGPCRVAQMSERDVRVLFGERDTGLVAYTATLPFDAPEVQKDDAFVVTKSEDTQLVNKPMEIHTPKFGSLHVARRVVLEEVRT